MRSAPSTPNSSRLLLITGSTRSGTSMAAGTLHYLGLVVPHPVLKANQSNPSGFFESVWPIGYHKRLLAAAGVSPTDARPEAFARVAAVVGSAELAELDAWLREVSPAGGQIVVKDPRSVWIPAAWMDAAARTGAEGGIISMLRHPAEVVASRTTYYGSHLDAAEVWRYRVRNLCTWINLNTGLEHVTRGYPRLVVRYEDLVADWRGFAARVGEAFDVRLDTEAGAAQAVDAFIDPNLRRHTPTWDGSGLPGPLIELAEATWEALGDLAAGSPDSVIAPRLDELRDAYAAQMRIAAAMTRDIVLAARRGRQGPGGQPAGSRVDGGSRRLLAASMLRRAIRRVTTPLR